MSESEDDDMDRFVDEIERLEASLPATIFASVLNITAGLLLKASGKEQTWQCGVCGIEFKSVISGEFHFHSEHPGTIPHYYIDDQGGDADE